MLWLGCRKYIALPAVSSVESAFNCILSPYSPLSLFLLCFLGPRKYYEKEDVPFTKEPLFVFFKFSHKQAHILVVCLLFNKKIFYLKTFIFISDPYTDVSIAVTGVTSVLLFTYYTINNNLYSYTRNKQFIWMCNNRTNIYLWMWNSSY